VKLRTVLNILKFFRWHIPGVCPVCGRLTLFLCLDDLAFAHNHLCCLFCRSAARNRLVARVLLEEVGGADSIAALAASNSRLIYNTATDDVFSRFLRPNDHFVCSGFFPDIPAGTVLGSRTFCQDLECLTFDDSSFDLVITQDVLEHVRDDGQAFAEIHRVLKPGGVHLFTIPFLFDLPTLQRVDTSGAEDLLLVPPEYHGDDIRGRILTYRTYGIDLFQRLEEIGFSTRLVRAQYQDLAYGIVDCGVFVSRKG
jgi:SAM-dependent methyltransferase